MNIPAGRVIRRLTLGLLLGALVVVLVATTVAARTLRPTRAADVKGVHVGDDFFSPRPVVIHRGGVVRWTWIGAHEHNVVGRGFRSAVKTSGTYSHRFESPGRFSAICTIHGFRMTVIVR